MGDILQSFKIVFGLDNKPLLDGVKQTESTLTKFAKTFNALAITYFSYSALKGVITGFADLNVELADSLALTGGNVENVTAMGQALKRFGGDTNSVINAMKSINGHLQELKFGGGAFVELARKYGISVNAFDSADKILLKLGQQLGKYDRQTRISIANTLGLDDSLKRAFADGGKELNKLIQKQKELGVTTEKDLKISQDFFNATQDLKDIFGALMRDFSRLVLPSFTKLADTFYRFIKYLREHKHLIIAFFTALFLAMLPVLATLTKMAIASAVAFAPFLAVGAVISAIALIIEDIYYYFMGWDSVTGDLVKRFPALKIALEYIKAPVLEIFNLFEKIMNFLEEPNADNFADIFKSLGTLIFELLLAPLEMLRDGFNALGNTDLPIIGTTFEWLGSLFGSLCDLVKWFIGAFQEFSLDNLFKAFSDLYDYVLNIFSNIKDAIGNAINSAKESVGNALSKLNPANWFGDDEEEKEQQKRALPQAIYEKEQQVKYLQTITAPTPSIPQPQNFNNATNTYNINNNINQNISSATPKQLADSTNNAILTSLQNQRLKNGI